MRIDRDRLARTGAVDSAYIAVGFVEAHQPVDVGDGGKAGLDGLCRFGVRQADADRDIGA
jgi:hypothetical protein